MKGNQATEEKKKGSSGKTSSGNAYSVNYDDTRFTEVEADKKQAISDIEKTYSGLIEDSDGYYQAQVDATKEWEKKQSELQQQQTDFAIDKIEQQKAQAKKEYIDDQSGAYADWQKQSNQYGANAEQRAAQGLTNTGFSESSQVSMYNTYQNRVTTARESYNNAVLNYNNAIKDARLQNNSALAEIAYNSLQKQLELSLQGFQYKNSLILEQSNKKLEVENMYYTRYQDVLQQINTENALAEQIRQFNESMALDREMFEWQKAQAAAASGGGGGYSYSGSGSSKKSKGSAKNTKDSDDETINRYIPDETINSSGNGGIPSDTKASLKSLGYTGTSADYVAARVASGDIVQSTSPTTGNPIYSAGNSNNINNDTSAYWNSLKY